MKKKKKIKNKFNQKQYPSVLKELKVNKNTNKNTIKTFIYNTNEIAIKLKHIKKLIKLSPKMYKILL